MVLETGRTWYGDDEVWYCIITDGSRSVIAYGLTMLDAESNACRSLKW